MPNSTTMKNIPQNPAQYNNSDVIDVEDYSEIYDTIDKNVFVWSTVTLVLILSACLTCICYFIWKSEEIQYEQGGRGSGDDVGDVGDVGGDGGDDDPESRREHRRTLILSNIFHEKIIRLDDNTVDIPLPHEKDILARKVKNNMSMASISAHSHPEANGTTRRKYLNTKKKKQKKRHFLGGGGGNDATDYSRDNHHLYHNDSISSISSENMNNESMRSIRQSMISIKVQGKSNRSSTQPTIPRNYYISDCPVCFESYHAGEEIAWSKNEKCQHAFHLDCIMGWLLDHDECPMCRAKYFNIENESGA